MEGGADDENEAGEGVGESDGDVVCAGDCRLVLLFGGDASLFLLLPLLPLFSETFELELVRGSCLISGC